MGFLSKLIGTISGGSKMEVSEQLLYDKVIGFRGIVPGVGTSTIVQNVAEALSDTTNYSICVLDVSFMYASQYNYFIKAEYLTEHKKDLLDYAGDIDLVVFPTSCRNVHLVALKNRGIVDMLSSKDSESTITNVLGALKSYFDVILVDIPCEYTYLSTYASIKCNKIINVAECSAKCMVNLEKSLNTMASLGVAFAKANKVILNKIPKGVTIDVEAALEQAGLNVIGKIYLSNNIAVQGMANKKVWGMASKDSDILEFTSVIDYIVESVVQKTSLTEKYYTRFSINDTTNNDDLELVSQDTQEEDNILEDEVLEDVELEDDSKNNAEVINK